MLRFTSTKRGSEILKNNGYEYTKKRTRVSLRKCKTLNDDIDAQLNNLLKRACRWVTVGHESDYPERKSTQNEAHQNVDVSVFVFFSQYLDL
jgi:hypothetical protein